VGEYFKEGQPEKDRCILVFPVLHQLFAEIPFFKNNKEEEKK
jgi:hypothetical protein